MKKKSYIIICLILPIILSGCTQLYDKNKVNRKKNRIALILGFGGVNDHSFNQSAWEGLQKWGNAKHLTKNNDFAYIETNTPEENSTNIDDAIQSGFTTIISLSYLQTEELKIAANTHPKINFALIDGDISGIKNLCSISFKDQESAYLAGLAAAYTTRSNKVGFIGGMEGPIIQRFQNGFEAGVKAGADNQNKKIDIMIKYAASYDSPDLGKALAASMFSNNADILYQAAGSTGSGVFQEAKARNESDYGKKVWVIGVDRDQENEGYYRLKNGHTGYLTLTSTKKNVGAAVENLSEQTYVNKFPGGKHLSLGLKENGVGLTRGHLSTDAYKIISEAKQKIIEGKLLIPLNN